jgi:hypothetical protein
MNKFQFFVLIALCFNILACVSTDFVSVMFFACSFVYIAFAFFVALDMYKKEL